MIDHITKFWPTGCKQEKYVRFLRSIIKGTQFAHFPAFLLMVPGIVTQWLPPDILNLSGE